ncbi:MAG: MaoC family dehydratase [Acidobacteria bacterium]|nr:MaoC family dehydratase [Acidobacteriota bacterium]
MSEPLPIYRVPAKNTAIDSDNKIHDDAVAAQYGFRGGLVPGVIVYAYMTAPLVARFGVAWLSHGSMQVKFHQPFYEGETVVVRGEVEDDSESLQVILKAEREDGSVCATAMATLEDDAKWLGAARLVDFPECLLPDFAARPEALRENFQAGALLGTLAAKFDAKEAAANYLPSIQEPLPMYYGAQAVAHPGYLLGLANEIFVRNFKLQPWIHVGSDLINHRVVRDGETLTVRGRLRDVFERQGHEMVSMDLLLVANEKRIVQQVRHTAIYRIRVKQT